MGGKRRLVGAMAAAVVAVLSAGGAWAATSTTTRGPAVTAPASDGATSTSIGDLPDSSSSSTATSATTTTTLKHEGDSDEHGSDGDDDASQKGAKPNGPCKPGWGHGDKNHCHTGPPGQLKRASGVRKPSHP